MQPLRATAPARTWIHDCREDTIWPSASNPRSPTTRVSHSLAALYSCVLVPGGAAAGRWCVPCQKQ